jgi:hypothetical protein
LTEPGKQSYRLDMRSISVLVGLCSLVAFADEPVEVFVDRNETYIRAGSASGLELGSMVTIWGDLIPTTKERRRAGTATVMEIWPSLARINLDDAAKSDKAAKKFATFEPKRRGGAAAQPTPPPAPPPAAAAPPPPPPPAAAPKPAAPTPGGIIKGHARFKGAGPWMVLTLWNDEAFDWTKCQLSLPGGLIYTLNLLKAGDHESIALSNFVQQGPERDIPRESVTVRCLQGASKFLFPVD